MHFIEISEHLNIVLQKLIEDDSYLLEHDVHEQTITGRIACYLSERIPNRERNGWNVDVEYNRNGDIPKALAAFGNIKPDILIHRRSLNNPNRIEDNNLLVVEVKKNPSVHERSEDLRKISAFIEESPFYYKYGAFIELRTQNTREPYQIIWQKRDED